MVVAIVIAIMPATYVALASPSYLSADAFQYFTLSITNLFPLAFSVLASLLYVPVVIQETRNSGWMPIMARRGRRGYVLLHALRAAAWGMAAFGAAIVVSALWSFLLVPSLGWVTYIADGALRPPEEQMTFSQLIAHGMPVFVVFMVAWTALHGALNAALCAMVALHLPNPFLAVLAVPVTLFVLNTVLSMVGLEAWTTDNAVLPTALAQGPMQVPMVTTGILLVVVSVSVGVASRSSELPRGLQ